MSTNNTGRPTKLKGWVAAPKSVGKEIRRTVGAPEGQIMSKLNDRQELFCLEYMKDLNATQAAIRAGYSEDSAGAIGFENLKKPNIQNRISELLEERSNEIKVDAQYVLKRLVEIDQMDVKDILDDNGTVKPIIEWPKSWRTTLSALDVAEIASNGDITGILKKIKWPDKVRNLELLGKHVDVSAFADKQEINMTVNPLDSILDEIENDARTASEEPET